MLGGKPVRSRPFPAWPVFDGAEEGALLQVLHSGKWWRYADADPEALSTSGSKVAEFQRTFAHFQGAQYGVACASGTAALEVSLKALGVGPGDEVIVPAYTFVATATAVLMVNAAPVFADIGDDTFTLDPAAAERVVTSRTKAIIPVHFAGQAADMGKILRLAERHKLRVIEDAAHGHGGAWNGRGLGSIGDAGAFSFQASKNMTAGEGGLIITSDEECARLCESYTSLGRKSQAPWYEHFRLGWNYRMTEFQGAILLQQLRRLTEQNSRRRENAAFLTNRLSQIPGIRTLHVPDYASRHSYHLYMFRLDEQAFGVSRASFLGALEKEGIPCSGGYGHPVYRNPVFLNHDFFSGNRPSAGGHCAGGVDYAAFAAHCPNAERASRDTVWLEHRLLLGHQEDMEDIVRAISKIYACGKELAGCTVLPEREYD